METVQVFIRIKPTNDFDSDVIELLSDKKSVNIHGRKEKRNGFINNQVLDWNFRTDGILYNVSQEEVYSKCVSQLVERTLDGYNSTLFAYGQTGAGKTYTMTGTTNTFQHRGIIPRVIANIYQGIKNRNEHEITVRMSYLEIYCEEMFDLLSTLNYNEQPELSVTEDVSGVTYVKGLGCHIAQNEEEALNLLFEGESNRVISHHQLNRNSSRSHCIFTVYVESHSRTQSNTKFTTSKFNLVDLAGSERLGKTLSKGHVREEAMYINKSLTFLEQTIIALEEKHRHHVPYRQSKLTHVLKDTLGGNCHTVMIGNIWGEEAHREETLSTLRFAARVMKIPCQPAVNTVDNPFRLCKQYELEVAALRNELAMYDTLTNRHQVNYEPLSDNQLKDMRLQVRKYLEDELTEIDVINLRQVKEIFVQFKSLYKGLSNKIEKEIREKYILQEKPDPTEKAPETIIAPVEKVGLQGETDGNGFNAGKPGPHVKQAQHSALVNSKKKNKKQKDHSDSDRRITPPSSGLSPNQGERKGTPELGATSRIVVDVPKDPITPPNRDEAFEMFKNDHGRVLNSVYLENKGILKGKKLESKTLSVSINQTKQHIDELREQLQHIQNNRESEEILHDGSTILDEHEYKLIRKLTTLKSSYRSSYEHLQNLRQDIVYCEKLVTQCRQKLLAEFQAWYKDSFGVTEEVTVTSQQTKDVNKTGVLCQDDDGERFDQVQRESLIKHPESVAFYNARIQTDRRRLFESTAKKRPGSVTTSIRNAPPRSMLIH